MPKPKGKPTPPNPTNSPFRIAEKYWRARVVTPDFRKAFDVDRIRWESSDGGERTRGWWEEEGGERRIECWKVSLCEIGDTGLGTAWKGKEKEVDGENAFAIIVPAIPGRSCPLLVLSMNIDRCETGLVLIPRALPPHLQRQLTRVSLHSTAPPNNTSLTPHYATPPLGIWKTAVALSSSHDLFLATYAHLTRIDPNGVGIRGPRMQVDFEAVNQENWKDTTVNERKLMHHPDFTEEMVVDTTKRETIADVLRKMRWVTIGWQYNVRPLSLHYT